MMSVQTATKKYKGRQLFWRSLLLAVFLFGWITIGNAAELTLHIENPSPTGTVAFMLFDSANAFGDLRDPAIGVRLPLDGRENYRIEDIPPGEYALLVHYDENNNNRVDKNFIGIPNEPLGFANNYRPKGPPSYSHASFVLREGESRHFDIHLYRPLGKRGRLGVGLGVIAQSSPYRDYNGGVYQVIPTITYIGNRLQIYGPYVQLGVVGSGKLRLAATAMYRIGAYEEGESPFLQGMGNRKSTVMMGLALQSELPGGVGFSAGYGHDILGRIGGGTIQLKVDKSFQYGALRFSPSIALNWLSSKLSNHDFGVPTDQQTAERPSYTLGDTISIAGGAGASIEIARNWLVMVNANVEFLGDEVTDSPIVSDDYVVNCFGAVTYLF